MRIENEDGQVSLFGQGLEYGKMCQAHSPADHRKGRTSKRYSKRSSRLKNRTFMLLDLRPGAGNLLGAYWEYDPPWLGSPGTLNTSACPRDVSESFLSQILQDTVPQKYYLSRTACLGILRRAKERGKALPSELKTALDIQAELDAPNDQTIQFEPYHINQRDEGIPLGDLSGALMATSNIQMQTFVTGTPTAFAANQRDEVRDLHDVAGALGARPGMKQQTFIAAALHQEDHSPAHKKAAAFSAGAGPGAGTIGYQEEVAPTLKASASGNCMPSVLCLNDQGGKVMECSEDISGTLRAQEHGHQPLIFDNHGRDARYTGPLEVAPTMSAAYGEGGNNVPLVSEDPSTFCIVGNIIDRQPQNGGNGIGVQRELAYTITSADRHAVYSRQRVDEFRENTVASTESARQHKDATDLICQQSGSSTMLIRRLTPLECERLQGFPDDWTNIPGASDSARYRTLGNSVAIPCVYCLLFGIASVAAMAIDDPYEEMLYA